MTYRTTNLRLRKVAFIRYAGNCSFIHVSLKLKNSVPYRRRQANMLWLHTNITVPKTGGF